MATVALVVATVIYVNAPVHGADGRDSSATINRPGADITDTYFFPSPATAGDVVAVMDVYPGIPAGQGLSTYFDPTVLYQMKFDDTLAQRTAGALPTEDLVLQFSAGTAASGTQTISVYGPGAPNQLGSADTTLPLNNTLQINEAKEITTNFGTFEVFAGARSDPFFFNTAAWYKMFPDRNAGSAAPSCLPVSFEGNGMCPLGFTDPSLLPPTNSQAGTNVLSIIVEMPATALTQHGGKIAYWATTSTANGL